MSSKANKKDFLNKKRKQSNEKEENSDNDSNENSDLVQEDKHANKNTGSKSNAKNSSKPEKYNEDILVGKDEVTLIVKKFDFLKTKVLIKTLFIICLDF